MTSRLTLSVLIDNTTLTDKDQFMAESGLSFYLQSDEKRILFDTGMTGLFLANAKKAGLHLRDLDFVVLSHGHNDHTGGLPVLSRYLAKETTAGHTVKVPELIAHPRCFWPKEKDGTKNGSPMTEAEVQDSFPTRLSDKPVWITDNLVFLGEIPRKFSFEITDPGKRTIQFPDGRTEPDLLPDDSALAFRSEEGLVIITGCSHAGICTIIEYAREVCDEKTVRDIIGGFHLLAPEPDRLEKTGKYLNRLHLNALHACHCTSLRAKIALARYCPLQDVGVGMTFEW